MFQASRTSVQLQPASVTTDVAEFEAALRAARRSRSSVEREQLLTEAVRRYRGELLPDHFEEWVQPERQRLAELFYQAIDELISLHEQSGDLPGALRLAHRLVGADWLREDSHHELIRLLVATGDMELRPPP